MYPLNQEPVISTYTDLRRYLSDTLEYEKAARPVNYRRMAWRRFGISYESLKRVLAGKQRFFIEDADRLALCRRLTRQEQFHLHTLVWADIHAVDMKRRQRQAKRRRGSDGRSVYAEEKIKKRNIYVPDPA